MVYLDFDGNKEPVVSIGIHEGIFQRTSYMTIHSIQPIPLTRFKVEINGQSIDMQCVAINQRGNEMFESTAYPHEFYKGMQNIYDAVNGLYDTKKAASMAGMEIVTSFTLGQTYWSIPMLKQDRLMAHLINNTDVSNGGCPALYCNIAGEFVLVDPICPKEPSYSFAGTKQDTVLSTEFTQNIPGAVNFVFYSGDSFEEQYEEFIPGHGVGTKFSFASTDDEKSYEVRKARIEFYREYLKNTSVRYDGVLAPYIMPGSTVKSNDSNQNLVLLESTMTYSDHLTDVSFMLSPTKTDDN